MLREPLEVALWRGDRRCGAVAVSLAGLHWRQQRRCAVPLPDGSATALTLEALDFGLPPANEDEGEELVAALPMHVVRENGLPVGQGLVCRSVRILVPWARLNGNCGNPMGWMGGGGTATISCSALTRHPHHVVVLQWVLTTAACMIYILPWPLGSCPLLWVLTG